VTRERTRRRTAMTPDQVERFLQGERTLILVTLRRDGSPLAHPLWFVAEGGALYVDTRADGLVAANARRDPRVCAVVESGESYFELRGVRVEGRCSRVDDEDEIARVRAARAEKDRRIGSGVEGLPAWFAESRTRRLARGERVCLRISMDRIFSWDFARLRDHYGASESAGGK
jgi:nitroimidazol reductase NimA-like FMN-containing flavoprotein (pyridoxamine 5'-phosphate oxidase superfamily)